MISDTFFMTLSFKLYNVKIRHLKSENEVDELTQGLSEGTFLNLMSPRFIFRKFAWEYLNFILFLVN